jgi:dolichyl-phosphate-mannose-protein mannosyltransferase
MVIRDLFIGIFIAVLFWLFAWQNIELPGTPSFDEFHYIPAAKAYLTDALSQGPALNSEHPPLGKMIIAQGISILGDNPQGWRLMSTIFGALTLLGIYLWALTLFSSVRTAIFVAVLTVANQMLYVQSRIAMLDTFMTAFLVWAAFCFSFWWHHGKKTGDKNWVLYASGAFLGLATACKWFAMIPFALLSLLLLFTYLRERKIRFSALIGFSLTAFFAYALFFHPGSLLQAQIDIWQGQRRVPSLHPYASAWWSWPLQLRPIWYFYEPMKDNNELVRGVVLLGNPLILWGGLVATFYCAWLAWAKRSAVAREILLAYLICLLGYAIVPRKLMFFYYYYPASLVLSLMIARALEKEWLRWTFAVLSLALFVHFLPVLNATPFPSKDLKLWTWFASWI